MQVPVLRFRRPAQRIHRIADRDHAAQRTVRKDRLMRMLSRLRAVADFVLGP